jgi:hypothetical protein
MTIGTLGSLATFAGEATAQMRALYPEFGAPSYFPSMDACWEELSKGTVDVVILGTERTGQPHHGNPIIDRGFYVMGELSVPLLCSLYVKPGADKAAIRKITGHGSIFQCTAYLSKNFPGVPVEMHALNSVEAAKEVMAGDGTVAVIGSRSLPKLVTGLEEAASAIDNGAISSWWAVTLLPVFSDRPDRVFITGRFGGDGQLGDLIGEMATLGYRLGTAASFAVNSGVCVYDYILQFAGGGELAAIEAALSGFPMARLSGAFTQRG